jgi:hypothetical protein
MACGGLWVGTRLRNPRCFLVMRTVYPQQTEGTTVGIAIHLAVCVLACGLFGFGFYKLMQPHQMPNSGMAADKPPPGTVVGYPFSSPAHYERQAEPALSNEQPLFDTTDETTGRAIQIVEPPAAVAPSPATDGRSVPAMKAVNLRTDSTKQTAPKKAQVPPGGYAAAHPGYAALH